MTKWQGRTSEAINNIDDRCVEPSEHKFKIFIEMFHKTLNQGNYSNSVDKIKGGLIIR